MVQWASLKSVAKDKQMAWIKTSSIFGLDNWTCYACINIAGYNTAFVGV